MTNRWLGTLALSLAAIIAIGTHYLRSQIVCSPGSTSGVVRCCSLFGQPVNFADQWPFALAACVLAWTSMQLIRLNRSRRTMVYMFFGLQLFLIIVGGQHEEPLPTSGCMGLQQNKAMDRTRDPGAY